MLDVIADVFRLGLGAKATHEEEGHNSKHPSTNHVNRLRKQLLGKRIVNSAPDYSPKSYPRPKWPVPTKQKPHDTKSESESEDEPGRTAIQRKSAKQVRDLPRREKLEAAPTESPFGPVSLRPLPTIVQTTASKKRSNSYLDEVLLRRLEKRQKTKKSIRGLSSSEPNLVEEGVRI
jgi:hypothetical protein